MLTHNLGYPRIGINRDLKRLVESYWNDEIDKAKLVESASALRVLHWTKQKEAGLDLVPSNDFSLYDQVLDMTLLLGAIPERYQELYQQENDKINSYPIDTYFAMARGLQDGQHDIQAMEMTKWFNTNYHYIVPEFTEDQTFQCLSSKVFDEYEEAKSVGVVTKPVLIGPVSYLLLGKEKNAPDSFHRLELLDRLLPVYQEILHKLEAMGVDWVQIDEPFLAMDLDAKSKAAFSKAYDVLSEKEDLNILLTTYFEGLGDNTELATSLPVDALHLDLVEAPDQLDPVLNNLPKETALSLGLINGRNIWKADLEKANGTIHQAEQIIGADRLLIAPSCSLLHCPVDLQQETDETALPNEVKRWMAFANQKLEELDLLKKLATNSLSDNEVAKLKDHQADIADKGRSKLVNNEAVQNRMVQLDDSALNRNSPYAKRKRAQQENIDLPDLFPTTTIGSFPQTKEVRQWRADFRKGKLSKTEYEANLKEATQKLIKKQEEIGLDMLVHGEFERNDMVEYFGEHFAGFAFTRNGWVQSYGTRGVKPPIIYGDVHRPDPITVRWSSFAQAQTDKPVKGMLTGPVTILQWSFVRDDQPRSQTAKQIALALRDEVADLEEAGIKAIQIDEPAFREGLPLRRADWDTYLEWAVDAFRIASTVVEDKTQIHTHMCYSEFNDVIEHIARLDADVISMETSRSQMELLDAFVEFEYPNEIGPGVYDIHSPRVPDTKEMVTLLQKAANVLDPQQIWVNPDCGLKTRGWEETLPSLQNMVEAARQMRKKTKSVRT
ncbi:5-methyltetrahydropteroyltriglutamate--homocysteine S-methyltransferase [Aliifodinibius sp. S!AR15-10]|uniref:5-methyltetrahydropteroyltriglutamate-- homocysteine S-methyltransferase n=1 Tax=Aliifodinibius sp. S!AR15-10 TaxID=2950437 RepID=UPI00285F0F3D|nr:5-methyltetrahydropteroyltriglutamate--homocysteine S-methyltransferase [Aliifodinibius sp. S!AR15-10]MDR8391200.1 5-methyltetrahydropteroyltriglutamate--homocysteine S-methyltransferase [Aliifodinibius sp. S!AR15-10]